MVKEQFSLLSSFKIFISGGIGFINATFCEFLVQLNEELVCIDNFSTGMRENLTFFVEYPYLYGIEGEIRNLETCKKDCEVIDSILHTTFLGFFQGILKTLLPLMR